jgi:hypothetical protein
MNSRIAMTGRLLLVLAVLAAAAGTALSGGCGSSSGGSDTGGKADAATVDAGFVIAEAGTFYGDAGDPDTAYSVTLVSDTFTIPAGKDVYKCQDFANPFHGQQVDIIKHESHMAEGSHHVLRSRGRAPT